MTGTGLYRSPRPCKLKAVTAYMEISNPGDLQPPSDLDFLRNALNITAVPPLPFASIGPQRETFKTLASILQQYGPTTTIFDAHTYISMLPPIYRYTSILASQDLPRCYFIDARGRQPLVYHQYNEAKNRSDKAPDCALQRDQPSRALILRG